MRTYDDTGSDFADVLVIVKKTFTVSAIILSKKTPVRMFRETVTDFSNNIIIRFPPSSLDKDN